MPDALTMNSSLDLSRCASSPFAALWPRTNSLYAATSSALDTLSAGVNSPVPLMATRIRALVPSSSCTLMDTPAKRKRGAPPLFAIDRSHKHIPEDRPLVEDDAEQGV